VRGGSDEGGGRGARARARAPGRSPTPPRPPPSPARLPGAGPPSSNLGWASLSGALDDFGPDAYLGPHSLAPDSAPLDPGPDPHSAMEARLRLGTAPVARRV